jgi:amino acid transporter
MTDQQDPDGDRRQVDTEFRTLLEGLRLSIPAVAVLFSFLLTLPLQAAFSDLRAVERFAFYLAFVSAALATVLMVAPSAHQRVRAPISGIPRRSPSDVASATWLSIAGTICFAISIGAAVYLVSALVFEDDVWAGIITALVAGVTAWSWFYMPLVTFNKKKRGLG